VRVPGVYLSWANPVFLAFFSFNGINNLRVFSVAASKDGTVTALLEAGKFRPDSIHLMRANDFSDRRPENYFRKSSRGRISLPRRAGYHRALPSPSDLYCEFVFLTCPDLSASVL
jgi:hypothetical protein